MPRYIDAEKIEIRVSRGLNDDGLIFIPMKDVHASIDRTPTADVEEVRHEHWEITEFSFGSDARIRCSGCHKEKTIREERRDFKRVLPRYCENCGAEMDGRRDT